MSHTLVTVLVILCFAAVFLGGTRLLRFRDRRTAAARRGEGFDDFSRSFGGEVPLDILRATYGYFSEWMAGSTPEFPVRASDSIYRVYGIVDEDLDDAALEILASCHRDPPADFQAIRTVSDLAYYVAAGTHHVAKA